MVSAQRFLDHIPSPNRRRRDPSSRQGSRKIRNDSKYDEKIYMEDQKSLKDDFARATTKASTGELDLDVLDMDTTQSQPGTNDGIWVMQSVAVLILSLTGV